MARLHRHSLSTYTWCFFLFTPLGCATAEIDPNAELYVYPNEDVPPRELPSSQAMGGALPVVIPLVQTEQPSAPQVAPVDEGCLSEPCDSNEPVVETDPVEPPPESVNPAPVNLVTNGDFATGSSHWNAHDTGFVERDVVVTDGMGCTNSGGLGWSGSSGRGTTLAEGTYVLSLRLKTTSRINVELKISKAVDPYEPVVLSETLSDLGAGDESYRFEFTINRELSNMGFLMSVDGGQACIDDLEIARYP